MRYEEETKHRVTDARAERRPSIIAMSFWMPSADTSATMRFQEERAVKVPEELKTSDLCMAACKQNGIALMYVPEEQRSPRNTVF